MSVKDRQSKISNMSSCSIRLFNNTNSKKFLSIIKDEYIENTDKKCTRPILDNTERSAVITKLIKSANELLTKKQRDVLLGLFEEQGIEVRVCSACDHIMIEGFCIGNGEDYYCSKKCLTTELSWKEYLELYNDGNGDSYWTQWL